MPGDSKNHCAHPAPPHPSKSEEWFQSEKLTLFFQELSGTKQSDFRYVIRKLILNFRMGFYYGRVLVLEKIWEFARKSTYRDLPIC